MNDEMSDNEFDNLINEGHSDDDFGIGLDDDLDDGLADDLLGKSSDKTRAAPSPAPLPQQDLSFFGKIPVHVTLEVASTEIPLSELMKADASSVIVLDKLAGEPLDVKVNGALFAKAEVVVMNGNYGLRIIELNGTDLNELAK